MNYYCSTRMHDATSEDLVRTSENSVMAKFSIAPAQRIQDHRRVVIRKAEALFRGGRGGKVQGAPGLRACLVRLRLK